MPTVLERKIVLSSRSLFCPSRANLGTGYFCQAVDLLQFESGTLRLGSHRLYSSASKVRSAFTLFAYRQQDGKSVGIYEGRRLLTENAEVYCYEGEIGLAMKLGAS